MTGPIAPSSAARAITMADVAILDRLVADLPPQHQISIGRSMLDDARINASPIMRGPLAAIREGLSHLRTANPAHASLLNDVRTTIDTEIGRIDGDVETVGLAGHPDYNAVGAARASLDLLHSLGAF